MNSITRLTCIYITQGIKCKTSSASLTRCYFRMCIQLLFYTIPHFRTHWVLGFFSFFFLNSISLSVFFILLIVCCITLRLNLFSVELAVTFCFSVSQSVSLMPHNWLLFRYDDCADMEAYLFFRAAVFFFSCVEQLEKKCWQPTVKLLEKCMQNILRRRCNMIMKRQPKP